MQVTWIRIFKWCIQINTWSAKCFRAYEQTLKWPNIMVLKYFMGGKINRKVFNYIKPFTALEKKYPFISIFIQYTSSLPKHIKIAHKWQILFWGKYMNVKVMLIFFVLGVSITDKNLWNLGQICFKWSDNRHTTINKHNKKMSQDFRQMNKSGMVLFIN